MADSLDFSLLPAKLRDYALADSSRILTRILVDGLGFTENFTMLMGNDEIPLHEIVVGDLLQPGGKDAFNPLNNKIQFKARIGKVRPCKVDLQFKPSQILAFFKTYLGKIAAATPQNPYDVPFEAFIMGEIVRKMKNEIRLKAAFKGVINTAGVTAADTMDGLLTIVAAGITTGNIPAANSIIGAAVTSTNALDEFRKLAEIVVADPNLGGTEMIALCSPLTKFNYNLDYQTTYGSLPYNNAFNKTVIDGTNITIVDEPGMAGHNGIIVTPKENLFWLVDDEQRTDSVLVEYALRNINIMMDFQAAVEYGVGEYVFTNMRTI